MENQHIVSVLVANHSGVLTKISGLFSRRGYNIDSLTVCATEDPEFSRMTILVNGDDYVLEQITKQLDKLYDVKRVAEMKDEECVRREMLLIKLNNDPEKLSQIMEITKVYKARTVDLSPRSMILELTGDSSKINAFIKILQPYGILEMARSGVSALFRADKCIKEIQDYNDII